MSRHDAAVFAHLALSKLRSIYQQTGRPVTSAQIADALKQHALDELEGRAPVPPQKHKLNISDAMELEVRMASPTFHSAEDNDMVRIEEVDIGGGRRLRFKFDQRGLDKYFGGKDPYAKDLSDKMEDLSLNYSGRDILRALCTYTELAVEIGKHLSARDVLNLYAASRAFHDAINSHLMSTIHVWINHRCPESGKVFHFKFYKRHLVPDPMRRTWARQYCVAGDLKSLPQSLRNVRNVPGLKYLQLVEGRDRCCREIIAIMARNGYRMPPSMRNTLLRLWLLMDMATSLQRQGILRNKAAWTDVDLYNAQFFFVKLGMHFNDPVYGPNTYELLHLMMGQKGLFPLWQLLMRKRFTHLPEILELKVRYDFSVPPDHWGSTYFDREIHGVPFDEIGRGHLESWGLGEAHLMRPDELVPLEAVTRGLELDKHLMHMAVWGYIDWATGENLVPTEDEMYISDEEQALAHMDTTHHWGKKHVLKKRFQDLAPEEQQKIIDDDEDERLRAMAWCGEDIDDYDSPSDSDSDPDAYDLDDEIHRGFIVPKMRGDDYLSHFSVPGTSPDDVSAWRDFANAALVGMSPLLDEDETLRAQAYHNYNPEDFEMEQWEWDELYQDQSEIYAQDAEQADDEEEEDEEGDSDAEQYIADPSTWTDDEENHDSSSGVSHGYLETEGFLDDDEEAETIVAAHWVAGD